MMNYEKNASRYEGAKERVNAELETLRGLHERAETLRSNLSGFIDQMHRVHDGDRFGSGADREEWGGELPNVIQERDEVARKILGDMFVLAGKHPVVARFQAKLHNGESFQRVKDILWDKYRVGMSDDSLVY